MENKYTLTLDLNVLNHLGLNLYSNIAAVLSEIVANAWDADAEEVSIDIFDNKIIIKDDGCGMDVEDINNKFLTVGYTKRERGPDITPRFNRKVMGRKGIGKLSLFSIAERIEVHSLKDDEKNSLLMYVPKIKIAINSNIVYHPEELTTDNCDFEKGTKIILTELKKSAFRTESYLRRRLARRFSVIGDEFNFKVVINGSPITVHDRDFYGNIKFLWEIGATYKVKEHCKNVKRTSLFNGVVDSDLGFEISGWIGAVENSGSLTEDKKLGQTNNTISLLARGKLAQEDILSGFNEGSLYTKYLIGEISADFLDLTDKEDIATSNRQALKEDDERYQQLLGFVYDKILKIIQKEWEAWSKEEGTEKALEKPAIKKWYGRLTTGGKRHAEKLFGAIQKLPVDREEDRNELFKYGILAFERLRVKDSLDSLDLISSSNELRFAEIFSDLDSIEAVLYYDIASARVKVIGEFAKIIDKDEKEKVIQKYIFDHLWLLHPSWERATEDSRMEQSVTTEFGKIKLTKEEKAGRLDIRYRTAAGKHIIVELKKSGRAIKIFELTQQINKYKIALQKCLKHFGREHEPIEIICLLGQQVEEYLFQPDVVRGQLDSVGARIIIYDTLIRDSLKSYAEYLEKQKSIGELREVINAL